MPKMDKKADKDVSDYLATNYNYLKDIYRYHAGLGVQDNVFQIPLNTFTEFIHQANIIDGKIVRMSDADTLFFVMINTNREMKNLPSKAIIRFQFLEIVLRLAFKKYLDTNLAKSHREAVKMLFENNLIPHHIKIQPHTWRWDRFYNQECDNFV